MPDFLIELAYRLLQRKYKALKRHAKYRQWQEIVKISILFDARQQHNVDFVRNLSKRLTAEGKKLELLALWEKNNEFMPDFPVMYEPSFFSFKPKGETLETFMERDADLLLVIAEEKVYAIDYVLALSKAAFKVAPDQYEQFADLVFRLRDRSVENFVDKVVEFTKNIKS